MNRYASIDIGSNSSLLLILERGEGGEVTALVDAKRSTKLSSGVKEDNRINEAAIARQLAALDWIAGVVGNAGVVDVVVCGTQIFRAAANGGEVAGEIEKRYGWKLEIISGEEEAELSYQAAATGLQGVGERRVVCDVGGGSTEIVFGRGERIEAKRSFPIGAVGLSEATGLTGRISVAEARAARARIKSIISENYVKSGGVAETVIFVGGTAATLGALRLKQRIFEPDLIHGVEIDKEWVKNLIKEFGELSVEAGRARLVFDPDRAEIIVAGMMIIEYIVDNLGCSGFIVSNRGVRWGLIFKKYPFLDVAGIKHRPMGQRQ